MNKTLRALLGGIALLVLPLSGFASGGEPAKDTYTQTSDPIVLVHGIIGWDKILGTVDYWYGIEDALERSGATVYVANLPALQDDAVRGEALIDYLEQLGARHGHSRFNLIAHSQGALTSRYAAGVRPDLVTSVSTLGGAHGGSGLADLVAGIEDNVPSTLSALVASFANAFGTLIDLSSGEMNKQDALGALAQLNSQGAAQWASAFPNGKPAQSCGQGAEVEGGIHWYSMGGTSPGTNLLDPFDLLANAGGLIFAFRGERSDGIIQRCSTHWGKVIRDDYHLNHADLINHVLGMKGITSPDVKAIYRQQANRLKSRGL
ncbi:MAG: esterase/lipase family protein [Pseudomonadota bacterium]